MTEYIWSTPGVLLGLRCINTFITFCGDKSKVFKTSCLLLHIFAASGTTSLSLVKTDAKYALSISAVTLSLTTTFPLPSTKGPTPVLVLVFDPAYLKTSSGHFLCSSISSSLTFSLLLLYLLCFCSVHSCNWYSFLQCCPTYIYPNFSFSSSPDSRCSCSTTSVS